MILCWLSDLLESEDLGLLAIKWFKLPARETQFPPNQLSWLGGHKGSQKGKRDRSFTRSFYEKVVEGFFKLAVKGMTSNMKGFWNFGWLLHGVNLSEKHYTMLIISDPFIVPLVGVEIKSMSSIVELSFSWWFWSIAYAWFKTLGSSNICAKSTFRTSNVLTGNLHQFTLLASHKFWKSGRRNTPQEKS